MKRLLTVFGVAGMAMASLAAVNDLLISFSTPGTDTYADGTTVLDGECYALVWSQDGQFEGVKIDGTPVDANDKVVLVAPVAKGGRCPSLIYQVDAELAAQLAGGQYGVYLLDTRRQDAQTGVTVGLDDQGALSFVRSAAAATDTGFTAGAGEIASAAAASSVGGASATALVEVEPPTVGIKVANATITLSVAGMNPLAAYWVEKGTTVKNISEKVADVPADDEGNGEVTLPAEGEAGFFKVKGGVPAIQ